eukprot:1144929-Pelagomonas_calceolata.AAC.4
MREECCITQREKTRTDKKKAGSVPQAQKLSLRQVEERYWKYKEKRLQDTGSKSQQSAAHPSFPCINAPTAAAQKMSEPSQKLAPRRKIAEHAKLAAKETTKHRCAHGTGFQLLSPATPAIVPAIIP